VLFFYRTKQGGIKDIAARIKLLQGLLSEFGIIMPKGRYPAQKANGCILEDEENCLCFFHRELLYD